MRLADARFNVTASSLPSRAMESGVVQLTCSPESERPLAHTVRGRDMSGRGICPVGDEAKTDSECHDPYLATPHPHWSTWATLALGTTCLVRIQL